MAHLFPDLAHVFNATVYKFFFGWLGFAVDLFFFLSGFVMYWVYVGRGTPINWAGFYSARAARILPLYYLTLLVFLPLTFYSMFQHGLAHVGAAYPKKLLVNFIPVSGVMDGWRATIDQPGWSISVEIFCYILLFPLLVMAQRGLAKSMAVTFLLAVALTAIDVSFYAYPEVYVRAAWDSTWLGRGLAGFAGGFLVCLLFERAPGLRRHPFTIDAGLFACLLVFLAGRLEWIPASVTLAVFPVAVFLTAYDVGAYATLLKARVFQWLGERSYSIYLWQFPLITFYLFATNKVIFHAPTYTYHRGVAGWFLYAGVVLFVLLASEASYRWFEVPARKWIKNLPSLFSARPGAADRARRMAA